jgi:hypothetical protein
MVSVIGTETRLPPLPCFLNSLCVPINLRPFQKAFFHPQAGGAGEVHKRPVVIARCIIEAICLATVKLADTFLRFLQPMMLPVRFVVEADAPCLGSGEQLLQNLRGATIDSCGRDKRRRSSIFQSFPMPGHSLSAPPRDQLCHIVVFDFRQQLAGPKVSDQPLDITPSRIRADVMFSNFLPIATGDIIEFGRRGRWGYFCLLFCTLSFGLLNGFSFALVRASRRAMKPITFELEVEVVERTVLVLVD